MFLSLIAVGVLFSCSSAGGYRLRGEVGDRNVDKVYLDFGGHVDSAVVRDGRFEFQGQLDAPDYCFLYDKTREFGTAFWIENSDIALTVDSGRIKVSGSRTEDEYQLYQKYLSGVLDEERAKVKEARAAEDAGDVVAYRFFKAEFDSLKKVEDDMAAEFVKQYPASYISLNHIYNCSVMEKYEFERLYKMARYLDTTAFEGKQWNTFRERYNMLRRFLPGNVFPDFSQKDVFGNVVKLSDYRGKYVLLTFSGSWEKGYRESNPLRLELYERYKDKGLEMLDVMLESEKEGIIKVVANDRLPWNLISEYNGWNNSVTQDFMIDHITVNYLIDPEGKIVAQDLFGDALSQKLAELFG